MRKMKNEMKKSLKIAPAAVLGVTLLFGQPLAAEETNRPELGEQVRHELVMLPFYSVFDNFEYAVDGDVVTLTGQVTRPTLKSDAEAVVKRLERVSQVINNIEVLPLSTSDDWIRRMAYRALYASNSPLSRYGWGSVPSIHILVKNGHITLAGAVDRESDKTIATILMRNLTGVFSVTNSLKA
jgi:hyperosmotically inducible protein